MRQALARLALLAIVILVIFGIYRLLTIRPLDPVPVMPYRQDSPLLFIDPGQSESAPPYTMAVLEEAVQVGADGVYLPLYLSRDGRLVVLASPDLAQVSDGTGRVSELTLEDLSGLDAAFRFDPRGDGSYPLRGQGVRLLTLDEVLQAFPNLRIIADLQEPTLPSVAALLQTTDLREARQRVLAVVDDQQLAGTLRQQAPDLATALTESEAAAFLTTVRLQLSPFYRPAAPALLLAADEVTDRLVRAAHSRGVSVAAITAEGQIADGLQSLLDGVIISTD